MFNTRFCYDNLLLNKVYFYNIQYLKLLSLCNDIFSNSIDINSYILYYDILHK